MSEYDPCSIYLSSSGSRGDRLLFKYPFEPVNLQPESEKKSGTNPYAAEVIEDYTVPRKVKLSAVQNGRVQGFDDKVLATILSPRRTLCNQKFEVKINGVIFCGYPVLHYGKDASSVKSFQVAFALQGHVPKILIESYHALSRLLAAALRNEEKRCQYFSQQKTLMISILDDEAAVAEDSRDSLYSQILQQCSLAQDLVTVFKSLKQPGLVRVFVNKWTPVSYVLLHKLHQRFLPEDVSYEIRTEDMYKCLSNLKPFHGMLLLTEEKVLRRLLPPDSSHSLHRLIAVASPLKNIHQLAADADIHVSQVLKLVSHLVIWGHATVIYPLSENNVYVLSTDSNCLSHSLLIDKFHEQCPGQDGRKLNLQEILSNFSLPLTLREHQNILGLAKENIVQVQLVVWLLKHKLLMQLHTYVFLLYEPTVRVPPQMTKSLANLDSKYLQSLVESRIHSRTTSFAEEPIAPQPAPSSPVTVPTTVPRRKPSLTAVRVNTLATPRPGSLSPLTATVDTSSVSLVPEVKDSNRIAPAQHEDTQRTLRASLLASLPAELRRRVENMPAARHIDDLSLFVKLYKYFDGLHHIEEMMYCLNLPRSEILTLIDKFRDILVTCVHEDEQIVNVKGIKLTTSS